MLQMVSFSCVHSFESQEVEKSHIPDVSALLCLKFTKVLDIIFYPYMHHFPVTCVSLEKKLH